MCEGVSEGVTTDRPTDGAMDKATVASFPGLHGVKGRRGTHCRWTEQ